MHGRNEMRFQNQSRPGPLTTNVDAATPFSKKAGASQEPSLGHVYGLGAESLCSGTEAQVRTTCLKEA